MNFKNFLGIVSLKTGSYIIGVTEAILVLSILIFLIVEISQKDSFGNGLIILIILDYLLYISFVAVMVYGSVMRKKTLLLPYMIQCYIHVLINIASLFVIFTTDKWTNKIFGTIFYLMASQSDLKSLLIPGLIVCFLMNNYFCQVIYSYYKQIRAQEKIKKNQNIQFN